jgi:hypothetical protein
MMTIFNNGKQLESALSETDNIRQYDIYTDQDCPCYYLIKFNNSQRTYEILNRLNTFSQAFKELQLLTS